LGGDRVTIFLEAGKHPYGVHFAAFMRHRFVVDMRYGMACDPVLGFLDSAVVVAGLAP
jgi:hypothetical protein